MMQKQPLIYELPGIPPIKMIYISGGTFIMGDGSDDDNPAHVVRLDDFFLAKFPVTQNLYQAVTQDNPSKFKGSLHPVETVSWYDVIEFCNLLSEKLGLEEVYTIDKEIRDTANTNESDNIKWLVKRNSRTNGFRLPTEAEWEYAAKSPLKEGGESTYAYSNRLEQIGWFRDNVGNETKEVGLKFPNQLGIYDMIGNVYEWCWDWYGDYNLKDRDNPTGAKKGSYHVIRGGGWYDDPDNCQVVNRERFNAYNREYSIGFRLALNLPH